MSICFIRLFVYCFTMAEKTEFLDQIVESVRNSPKYREIDVGLVRNVAEQELEKRRGLKEAVKATKNKLHQVASAYQEGPMDYARWLKDLRNAANLPVQFRTVCKQIMRHHASTRERLGILEPFYQETLSGLPPVRQVLDVACGLNPLALPWMNFPSDIIYHAVDIYQDLTSFLNQFLSIAGVHGSAETADVLEFCPSVQVDLALVLKTIPCLEQLDKTAGRRLLEVLQANYLLVSFPAQSLGGRDKRMVENYEQHFLELVSEKGWTYKRFEFPTELAFLVTKKSIGGWHDR